MLKFKLHMDGYYIVVPEMIYNWNLLDGYIEAHNITNIKHVFATYQDTIKCDGGTVHDLELLDYDYFSDKKLVALIEHNGIFGYYIILSGTPIHVLNVDLDESFFRTLLNDTYEPHYKGARIANRKQTLKLFTHDLIIGDRNALR